MTIFSKTKNLLFRGISSSVILSSLLVIPTFAETFKPTKFTVKFYSMGLSNSDRSELFKVFDNSEGVEVDLVSSGSIQNLATGIQPVAGTFTHIYGITGNKYTVAGSKGTCYIKAGSYDKATSGSLTGWAAATTNESESGEAVLTEQDFDPGSDSYGPATPNTTITVQGTKVSNMKIYLTNSSAPYTTSDDSSLSRDRSLYFGELATPITIEDESQGKVIITFDASEGAEFDDDCALGMDLDNNKYSFSIVQD